MSTLFPTARLPVAVAPVAVGMIGGAVQALAAALTVSITGGIPVSNVPAGSAAPSLSRIGSVQLPAANVGLVPEGNPLAWGENRTARPATQAVIDAWVQTSAVGELPDVPGHQRAALTPEVVRDGLG